VYQEGKKLIDPCVRKPTEYHLINRSSSVGGSTRQTRGFSWKCTFRELHCVVFFSMLRAVDFVFISFVVVVVVVFL
jgi:hypothetical protein